VKPKERVMKTLNFEEPDRVPLDFSGDGAFIDKLYSHFKIKEKKGVSTPLVSCPDPQILEALGCDFRMVAPEYTGPPLKRYEDGTWINLFGVMRKPQKCDESMYYAYEGTPLKGKTLQEVEDHPWPDPDWFDYNSIVSQCKEYGDYAIVTGYPGNVDFLNKAGTLYGIEDTLKGMLRKDPVLFKIFDKLSDFFYEYNRRIFEAGMGMIDIAYYGDDYGSQHSPIISPEMYRTILRPRWERHIACARSYGLKIMQHSCGSVGKLIPSLLDTGIEILDVVQPDIAGMKLEELKRDFGKKLTFHGALCIQKVVPCLPVDKVCRQVERVLSIMAPGGGFILAPTNKVPVETPVENLLAAYETAVNYSRKLYGK